MTWEGMLGCELVVVGKYRSHQDSDLVLQVDEVLKGNAKRRQLLTVKLEHLYTVETGAVAWESVRDRNKEINRPPRLCYKRQIVNPGGLEPVPLLDDAHEPAIYFLPNAAAPALKRLRQVQPLADRQGWRQALDGMPMDVMFRLTQNVSNELSRDALEELGKSRDPASLERLFSCVVNAPPQSALRRFDANAALMRLGDKAGDVYDRAAKLLRAAAPGTNDYRFYPLAQVMAYSDSQRAADDLPLLIADDQEPLAVRKAALGALGILASRRAAQLSLEYLRDPDLAEAAAWSIRRLLAMDANYGFPKRPVFADCEWLREQLRTLSHDEATPASVRKLIDESFRYELRIPSPLDIDKLRSRLLNPSDPVYSGRGDGETADMLRESREICDPRMIPLLVEVLDKVPAASGNHAYGFQEALKFYAIVCPREMADELKKRKLPERLETIPGHKRSFMIEHALEAAGVWPSRSTLSATRDVKRCHELAKQVKDGHDSEADLLAAVEGLVEKHGLGYMASGGLAVLIDAGTPAARERFLTYVQEAKKAETNRITHEPTIDVTLTFLLHQLFPNHVAEYREQVLALLRSKSLVERKAGADSLNFTLQCDFDCDPAALEGDRLFMLERMEPWLERLPGKTEIQMRRILLERAGLTLAGNPGDSWLAPLATAASGSGAAVPHALRLIELMLGKKRCSEFANWRPAQRARAIRAYLADVGKPLP